MVALRCFIDAELLWQHAKISLSWLASSLSDTITLPDLYNNHFGTRIWHLSPNPIYKPSYSQFYVQIFNFSIPWQQGSVGGQFE